MLAWFVEKFQENLLNEIIYESVVLIIISEFKWNFLRVYDAFFSDTEDYFAETSK